MDSSVDTIKSKQNIVDLVSNYVKLERAGQYWKAACPFHQERTPSFMVNEERGTWHCFGCNKGGDIFSFIMEIENLEFREALVLLAERNGVELPRYNPEETSAKKTEKERLLELMELATRFYRKQLEEGSGQKEVKQYLLERGLSPESMESFRLGYSPQGWDHFTAFAQKQGFTPAEMISAGLAIKKDKGGLYDRFRNRIMFPIRDVFGRVVGFTARLVPESDTASADGQAKYINTPESPLYHKGSILYGIDLAKLAIKQAENTILVEGNMDVIALHQAGVENVVAASGTALTPEQLKILKRYAKKITLFFDMDEAGQQAARKSTELALDQEFEVSLVSLTEGKDAADLALEDVALLKQAVQDARPAPEYFLARQEAKYDTKTPHGKRSIVTDFGALLLHIKHPVEREHWLRELAKRTGVSEDAIQKTLLDHSQHASTTQTPEPATLPEVKTRAEILREELVTLLLVTDQGRTESISALPEAVRSYAEGHPLFFFLNQAGDKDPLSMMTDETLRQAANKLMFQRYQEETSLNLSQVELEKERNGVISEVVQTLNQEVAGKGQMRALEDALKEAQARGDREKERALLAQLQGLIEASRE